MKLGCDLSFPQRFRKMSKPEGRVHFLLSAQILSWEKHPSRCQVIGFLPPSWSLGFNMLAVISGQKVDIPSKSYKGWEYTPGLWSFLRRSPRRPLSPRQGWGRGTPDEPHSQWCGGLPRNPALPVSGKLLLWTSKKMGPGSEMCRFLHIEKRNSPFSSSS